MEAGAVVELSTVESHTGWPGGLRLIEQCKACKCISRDPLHKIMGIPIFLSPSPSTSHSESCHWDVMQKSQPGGH